AEDSVISVHTDDAIDVDQMTKQACAVARRDNFAQAGQFIVTIAGMPFGSSGTTNLFQVVTA
ncbi:MAG: pyruvate kinase, partial [Proteobacteria bacterium]